MEFHPIANEYPLMSDAEIAELADDIKANGQQQPVWLYEGKILDGRNRWRACQQAGVECLAREYLGDDPAGFAASANLYRKHYQTDLRQRLVAKLRRKGMSTRAIAEAVGVHHATVARDVDLSTVANATVDNSATETETGHLPPSLLHANGGVATSTNGTLHAPPAPPADPPPQRITGKDGKSRPAKRTAKDKLAERNALILKLHAEGLNQRNIAKKVSAKFGTTSQPVVSGVISKARAAAGEEPPAEKREATGKAAGESIDWLAVLRWAAKKGRVTPEEIKERWEVSQKAIYQNFTPMIRSQGFLVGRSEDGSFLVSKAVHFVPGDDGMDIKDIKDMLRPLYEEAIRARKCDTDFNTSTQWTREERWNFLFKFIGTVETILRT